MRAPEGVSGAPVISIKELSRACWPSLGKELVASSTLWWYPDESARFIHERGSGHLLGGYW
jgi:hypothetical protein